MIDAAAAHVDEHSPLRRPKRDRDCAIPRPRLRNDCAPHRPDGRLHQALLPSVSARRDLRQAGLIVGRVALDRRRRDRPARTRPRDSGYRDWLRAAHVWPHLAVGRGVRRLPVRLRNALPKRHYQAVDFCDDCAGCVHVHDGRDARHAANPEHHPDNIFQGHVVGRAVARPDRLDVHLRCGRGLSRSAEPRRATQGRRLPHESA